MSSFHHRLLVLLSLGAAALPASAARAQSRTEQAQRLPAVVTTAEPLMAEIYRHIADSATLASMNERDRYLRLKRDNRYLETVLDAQGRRIEQLEKRLKALQEAREKARRESRPLTAEESAEVERALARLRPATSSSSP